MLFSENVFGNPEKNIKTDDVLLIEVGQVSEDLFDSLSAWDFLERCDFAQLTLNKKIIDINGNTYTLAEAILEGFYKKILSFDTVIHVFNEIARKKGNTWVTDSIIDYMKKKMKQTKRNGKRSIQIQTSKCRGIASPNMVTIVYY